MGLNIKDLSISSPDVDHLGRFDDRFAYDKGNEVPRLQFSGVPEEAVELAVICHDPDAPLPHGWTHWTLYGIPADVTELGTDADDTYRAGPNDYGEQGWGGPYPPPGHGDHHYYLWVYALSRPVDGAPTRREFLDGYGDAIVEQNRMVATYSN